MRVTLAVAAAVGLAAIGALNPLHDSGTVAAQASHSPWGSPTQGATQTVLDGVYTLDQARRGEQIYKQRCARCHRENLLGNTVNGANELPVGETELPAGSEELQQIVMTFDP